MIDTEELHKIFIDCLFSDDEVNDLQLDITSVERLAVEKKIAVVHSVIQTFVLNPDKLKLHEPVIKEMTGQLNIPDDGTGVSFLDMCVDVKDCLWTGFHIRVNELLTLGIAVGVLSISSIDRSMWKYLPGGTPIVTRVRCQS